MATEGKIKRQHAGRSKGKIILIAVEIIIILVMIAVLYLVMSKSTEGPQVLDLKPEEVIPSGVIAKLETTEGDTGEPASAMHGYMNIALFGLDAETDSQLYKGSRSDSLMVASINLDTGDIKLVSVYRDTYLNLGTDKYEKCTHAYAYGGAAQSVKMLNMNLDLDITNFVAVSYRGLSEVIDGLGGVWVEVDEEELKHINNYQIGVANVLKCDYTMVTTPGYQLLNGIQATAYCRIRQTAGSDYKRTERQREVLKAIEEQAKKTDLVTLTKVFNDCIGDIYTSIDSKDILDLISNIANYRIVDENGFPQPDMRGDANMGANGACVIPTSLEDNVVWLHKFLFDEEDYEVTESVKEYSDKIHSDSAQYLKK